MDDKQSQCKRIRPAPIPSRLAFAQGCRTVFGQHYPLLPRSGIAAGRRHRGMAFWADVFARRHLHRRQPSHSQLCRARGGAGRYGAGGIVGARGALF